MALNSITRHVYRHKNDTKIALTGHFINRQYTVNRHCQRHNRQRLVDKVDTSRHAKNLQHR
jgi:hypothetical protein